MRFCCDPCPHAPSCADVAEVSFARPDDLEVSDA